MIFENIVGITGLTESTHTLLMILMSIMGSIIAAIIIPRICSPLFLKMKNKIFWRYKNGYIKKTSRVFDKKKIIIRILYMILLTLGFLAFLIPLIDPYVILGADMVNAYNEGGTPPQYSAPMLFTLVTFLLPLVVGLWSISWALEDSGLMHYKFDDRPGYELYEIEPIYVKYGSLLRGFSGISAIVFFYGIIYFFTTRVDRPYWEGDVLGAILLPVLSASLALPGYLLYGKLVSKSDYLRKGLTELETLSEKDIKK